MAIRIYILVITLNVNRSNAPTKRHRLPEGTQKIRPIFMLSVRDALEIWGHTKTEGIEKGIPCKWKSKESWSSNTHIRKNRL